VVVGDLVDIVGTRVATATIAQLSVPLSAAYIMVPAHGAPGMKFRCIGTRPA